MEQDRFNTEKDLPCDEWRRIDFQFSNLSEPRKEHITGYSDRLKTYPT